MGRLGSKPPSAVDAIRLMGQWVSNPLSLGVGQWWPQGEYRSGGRGSQRCSATIMANLNNVTSGDSPSATEGCCLFLENDHGNGG
ncbi:hypothetical protein [Heliophilum fasciatum]|uniref:hypothetical protein n=1 Tax=Heliophilum fasciatum TaxID=35700 RepID=UPI00104E4910|nr:hypothetical protein [Heliophilum fasciatum]MCW2279412.1 hypothetical protein [Heliophilum fasciatum]